MAKDSMKGYRFIGWYIDEERTKRINPGGKLPDTTMLYDKWVPEVYRVHYHMEEGVNSRRNPRWVTVESGIKKLYPPINPGRYFVGWFSNGRKISFLPEGIHEEIHLEARFAKKPVIHFDSMGGGRMKDRQADETGKIAPFRAPKRLGYDFVGWYFDKECRIPFDISKPVSQDVILYARWDLTTYQVFYHLEGGRFDTNVISTYTYESQTFFLPIPKRRGYRFVKWVDSKGSEMSIIRHHSLGDREVFALWKMDVPEVHVGRSL